MKTPYLVILGDRLPVVYQDDLQNVWKVEPHVRLLHRVVLEPDEMSRVSTQACTKGWWWGVLTSSRPRFLPASFRRPVAAPAPPEVPLPLAMFPDAE